MYHHHTHRTPSPGPFAFSNARPLPTPSPKPEQRSHMPRSHSVDFTESGFNSPPSLDIGVPFADSPTRRRGSPVRFDDTMESAVKFTPLTESLLARTQFDLPAPAPSRTKFVPLWKQPSTGRTDSVAAIDRAKSVSPQRGSRPLPVPASSPARRAPTLPPHFISPSSSPQYTLRDISPSPSPQYSTRDPSTPSTSPHYGLRDLPTSSHSPHYGIRDLPSASPAYGIRDLPPISTNSSPTYGIRDLPTINNTRSPAYGIRDLPRQEEVKSPMYGIRDLPLRNESPEYGIRDIPDVPHTSPPCKPPQAGNASVTMRMAALGLNGQSNNQPSMNGRAPNTLPRQPLPQPKSLPSSPTKRPQPQPPPLPSQPLHNVNAPQYPPAQAQKPPISAYERLQELNRQHSRSQSQPLPQPPFQLPSRAQSQVSQPPLRTQSQVSQQPPLKTQPQPPLKTQSQISQLPTRSQPTMQMAQSQPPLKTQSHTSQPPTRSQPTMQMAQSQVSQPPLKTQSQISHPPARSQPTMQMAQSQPPPSAFHRRPMSQQWPTDLPNLPRPPGGQSSQPPPPAPSGHFQPNRPFRGSGSSSYRSPHSLDLDLDDEPPRSTSPRFGIHSAQINSVRGLGINQPPRQKTVPPPLSFAPQSAFTPQQTRRELPFPTSPPRTRPMSVAGSVFSSSSQRSDTSTKSFGIGYRPPTPPQHPSSPTRSGSASPPKRGYSPPKRAYSPPKPRAPTAPPQLQSKPIDSTPSKRAWDNINRTTHQPTYTSKKAPSKRRMSGSSLSSQTSHGSATSYYSQSSRASVYSQSSQLSNGSQPPPLPKRPSSQTSHYSQNTQHGYDSHTPSSSPPKRSSRSPTRKPVPSIEEPPSYPEEQQRKMTIKAPTPRGVPQITLPDDDDDDDDDMGGPMISVQDSSTPTVAVSQQGAPGISISIGGDDEPEVKAIPNARELREEDLPPPISQPRSALACGGCDNIIVGRTVSAMGVKWHPACFKCVCCKEALEHVSSYEGEGRAWCHLCYHERYAPRCYHCKTAIVEERYISLDDTALGVRAYHEHHFFCAECGDPFLDPSSSRKGSLTVNGDGSFTDDDVGFTVYQGHPYCESCHVRLRMPRCKRCNRSIRPGDEAVEALGGKWCWSCFVCKRCERPFDNPSFFEREGHPFCENCYSVILRNEV